MNKQPTTLEQRCLAALQPDVTVTSAYVAALMEEVDAGIAKAEKEREVDQTLALDPKAARQAIAPATMRRWPSCIALARLAWGSICFRPSCMPAGSTSSVTDRRRFSLRCSYSIGTAVSKSSHRSNRQWQLRSLQPRRRVMAGALPPTGQKTASAVPRASGRSNSAWLTTMRARPRNKRIGKMQRRGSVSLRASAGTASDHEGRHCSARESLSAPDCCHGLVNVQRCLVGIEAGMATH